MAPTGKPLLGLVVGSDIAQASGQTRIDAARPGDETPRRARFGGAKGQLKLLAQHGWKELRRQGAIRAGNGEPSGGAREQTTRHLPRGRTDRKRTGSDRLLRIGAKSRPVRRQGCLRDPEQASEQAAFGIIARAFVRAKWRQDEVVGERRGFDEGRMDPAQGRYRVRMIR